MKNSMNLTDQYHFQKFNDGTWGIIDRESGEVLFEAKTKEESFKLYLKSQA